jgi:hypothetical protein
VLCCVVPCRAVPWMILDTSGSTRQATPIGSEIAEQTDEGRAGRDGCAEHVAKRQRPTAESAAPKLSAQTSAASGTMPVPYIGVGLEVYCAVEPCLMCAMALVHSRVSRVVYQLPLQVRIANPAALLWSVTRLVYHARLVHLCLNAQQAGGLGSAACLQSLKSLNHKLEVWKSMEASTL